MSSDWWVGFVSGFGLATLFAVSFIRGVFRAVKRRDQENTEFLEKILKRRA